jgi:hypothetical protein
VSERCAWCGASFEAKEGPVHDYIESSPGCWEAYGKVISMEFADWTRLGDINRLTVDTYAVQHPGRPGRRSVQSVAGHLISMFLVLRKGHSGAQATQKLRIFVEKRPSLVWLEPPDLVVSTNISDVLLAKNTEEHERIVRKWAELVFERWYSKHADAIDRLVASIDG